MSNNTKKKKKKSPGGINRTYGRQAAEFAVRGKPSYFNSQINKGAASREYAEVINNYFSRTGPPDGVAMGGRRKTRRRRGERRRKTRRKQRGGCPPCLAALALLGGSRKTRRKTRRKARRKARFRRGKRRRKTRRRRGGIGFRNSTPLKSVKKPHD